MQPPPQRKFQSWAKVLMGKPRMLRWYVHWRNSLAGNRSPLADELPWMTYEAIDWLRGYLAPEMRIFEWGSGGSTLFFGYRVRSVVTIEHDPSWYAEVSNAISQRGVSNVHLKLIEPERSRLVDQLYVSKDERYSGLSFQRYADSISAFKRYFQRFPTGDLALYYGKFGCLHYNPPHCLGQGNI